MLLIPFALFSLFLMGGAWLQGMRAWRRSNDPAATGYYRTGLRLRAGFQFALSALPCAGGLVSLGLSWVWLSYHRGQGWLYWGEVAVYLLCHVLILLTWWIIFRYEVAGSPATLIAPVVARVVAVLLYPFLVDRGWPLTGVTTLLFLLLGGVLLWFQSRFFSVLSTPGLSPPGGGPARKESHP
jgi:hypothetical protein